MAPVGSGEHGIGLELAEQLLIAVLRKGLKVEVVNSVDPEAKWQLSCTDRGDHKNLRSYVGLA